MPGPVKAPENPLPSDYLELGASLFERGVNAGLALTKPPGPSGFKKGVAIFATILYFLALLLLLACSLNLLIPADSTYSGYVSKEISEKAFVALISQIPLVAKYLFEKS